MKYFSKLNFFVKIISYGYVSDNKYAPAVNGLSTVRRIILGTVPGRAQDNSDRGLAPDPGFPKRVVYGYQ